VLCGCGKLTVSIEGGGGHSKTELICVGIGDEYLVGDRFAGVQESVHSCGRE
jgi:hypothetical protein